MSHQFNLEIVNTSLLCEAAYNLAVKFSNKIGMRTMETIQDALTKVAEKLEEFETKDLCEELDFDSLF